MKLPNKELEQNPLPGDQNIEQKGSTNLATLRRQSPFFLDSISRAIYRTYSHADSRHIKKFIRYQFLLILNETWLRKKIKSKIYS